MSRLVIQEDPALPIVGMDPEDLVGKKIRSGCWDRSRATDSFGLREAGDASDFSTLGNGAGAFSKLACVRLRSARSAVLCGE
jgi:hypothetical protein